METKNFSHGYALIIGVGGDLPVTERDAEALYNILIDPNRCAYLENHVKLLTGTKANRKGILEGLEWLTTISYRDQNATVLLYFSGHGGFFSEYYLVPYGLDIQRISETTVSGAELSIRLQSIQARRVLVLLDCCHSGGLVDVKAIPFVKSPVPPELDTVLSIGMGRVVIASSRRDEVSYTGNQYSVFTQALREAIAGYGTSDYDGLSYVADIALHIGRVVPSRTSNRQHPILRLSGADNFPIGYYSGGKKEVEFLSGLSTNLENQEIINYTDIAEGYLRILAQYKQNLLETEERMAVFYDQAAIPLDLERAKAGILSRINELESRFAGQQKSSSYTPNRNNVSEVGIQAILSRFDKMEINLGDKLEDLKQGQIFIYKRVSLSNQAVLEDLLKEVQAQRVRQTLMINTMTDVRKALEAIQKDELPVINKEIKDSLIDIYKAINASTSLEQQFELSLPVIPFLLEYKVNLGGGVDLGAVWEDLVKFLREGRK